MICKSIYAGVVMTSEGMGVLPENELMNTIKAHILSRPDLDPAKLHSLANTLSQRADEIEREARDATQEA